MDQENKTVQLQEWEGDFGREYTDRNSLMPQQVDDLWRKNYGLSRTDVNLSGPFPALTTSAIQKRRISMRLKKHCSRKPNRWC